MANKLTPKQYHLLLDAHLSNVLETLAVMGSAHSAEDAYSYADAMCYAHTGDEAGWVRVWNRMKAAGLIHTNEHGEYALTPAGELLRKAV